MTVSPFLPGTHIQFAWDSTSLSWFKECPRKYYYNMIMGYRPKGDSVHLIFGQWYHSCLEQYDKLRSSGLDHEEALLGALELALNITWDREKQNPDGSIGGPITFDHPNKTRETLIRSVIWYVEHFKDDAAKTVQLANGKPAVELSFKMQLDWAPPGSNQPYILCGHIDRLVEFLGGNYVMDRKTTTTTIGSSYFDNYDPDNQMSLYTVVARVIYSTPVKGVIIDGAQIAVGFSRFSRGFTYRTDAKTDEWLNDLRYWFEQARECAVNDNWPMNDKSCHNYGGCAFRKVCSKSPEVRDIFLRNDFTVKEWNPLVPR